METLDTDTTMTLPQEAEITEGSAKTILNSPLESSIKPNPKSIKSKKDEDETTSYIDTPQRAVIIGHDPRWRRNLCACRVKDGHVRVSGEPNPKRLKTLEEIIRVCETRPSSSTIATSEDDYFVCQNCVHPKPVGDSLRINNCSHDYCSDCVIRYLSCKLQNTTIRCPLSDCKGTLEAEHCLSILPQEKCRMFYCPFEDCNVMLIDDDGVDEVVRELECPHCWRLFCARCTVPRHVNINGEEFQELMNKDERRGEDAPSVVSKDLMVASSWIVGAEQHSAMEVEDLEARIMASSVPAVRLDI